MSDPLLLLGRGFHFGSGMILVGVVAFRWLVLLPAFVGETEEVWQTFAPFFRQLSGLFLAAGITQVLSGLLIFWAVTADMSGSTLEESLAPDTWRTVLFQTQFGTVFLGRGALGLALAAMMAVLTAQRWYLARKLSGLEILAGVSALVLFVSFSLTGHAAATGGPTFYWRVVADATHLGAVTLWPTGLLPFALFLGRAARLDGAFLRPVRGVMSRFSSQSFFVVGVLVGTGILNTVFIVGSFRGMVTTPYGLLLCLKIALFLVIMAFAAWNRYHLLPLIFRRSTEGDPAQAMPLFLHLRRCVLSELAFSVAVIAVVSLLGTTPPR